MKEVLAKINLPPGSVIEAAEALQINIGKDILDKLENDILEANELVN